MITLAALRTRAIWVGWKTEMRADKDGKLRPTKVPYSALTGRKAKSDDPLTWATRDKASEWAAKMHADGIGLVLGEIDDAIVGGVDLDTCRDPSTKIIEPWAQAVIDRFATYAEVSPSGCGVKLFFSFSPADLPVVAKLFGDQYGRTFKKTNGSDHPPAIELHRGRRYFTTTEEMISDTDDLRCVALADLEWLICDHGPKFAGQNTNSASAKASSKQNDQSRSAKAFRAGVALKGNGATYEQMRDGLLQHEDSEIAEWANSKGRDNNERELHKVYDKAWARGATVTIAGVEKRLVTLDELNDRFALLEAPRLATVYVARHDYLTIQENDLKRRIANEVVLIGVKDGKPIYSDAFKFWTGHARRHIYRRIAFTNKELPDDTLNLFRGFGVTPKEGDCSRILAHIEEVICSGDMIATEAILDLMAWQMQNIGKPSRVIVIMRTESHQAGKGLLLAETLLKIYGDAGFIPSSVDQVLGRFNDTIVGRAYVFLDEAMFFGDRRAADNIKSLSTTDRYGIETKGLPTIQCPVGLNFWMATNHTVAAFIEEKDVRYWVINVSEHRVGDTGYFSDILEELENGGREAFAHLLLNRGVSNFTPLRDVPKNNDAKREMIKRTINPYDARKWIEECCTTGQIIGHRKITRDKDYRVIDDMWWPWVEGALIAFSSLSNAYTEWQKTVKSAVRPDPTPIGSLGEVLTAAGLFATRTATERQRKLPDPDKCLSNLYKLSEPATASEQNPASKLRYEDRWKHRRRTPNDALDHPNDAVKNEVSH